jgi:glycosyltransferase involved in cell wall biosynthesis
MSQKRLFVVSDTKIQRRGSIYWGFSSVVRELGVISSNFERIQWIGSDYSDKSEDRTLLEIPSNVRIIALTIIDFTKVFFKIRSIFFGFKYIFYTLKLIFRSEIIHVRGPNFISLVTLLIAPFFRQKKWWFKFANNWNDTQGSLSWGIQKWLLMRYSFMKVTINGNWPQLPKHIIPFENPCFYMSDLNLSLKKDFSRKKKVVFIGRITEAKGVFRILNALTREHSHQLESVTFVGDGPESDSLQTLCEVHPCKSIIKIVGGQSKDEVMNILKESHFLFLPTTSPEGFPKVVAEAWLNYCIPVVSNVSSIPQYVRDMETGILWNMENESWDTAVERAFKIENYEAERMFQNIKEILPKFTYEYFGERVKREIFKIEG